ncbi:tetratricopeptide repeat-containing sulfotransferase family protein [Novosphingobium profundi]|uniref:tetratricopeptide repeat-containing sulfotransferase family protein n=1 Tax=Novosphingobium profundi TaxID=1774954 RepID=UPI001CFD70DA|nr:tetratricopeptide repeat-containing sulfotransferase family protein [Novosphingobium profundi]
MTGSTTEAARPVSPARALPRIAALISSAPARALAEAENLLQTTPGLGPAELLACQALRQLGRTQEALSRLETLARRDTRVPAVLWDLAQTALAANASATAISALERLTALQPGISHGWFLLASELRKAGRAQDAWRADISGVHASAGDPELVDAALAMNEGRLDEGIALLEARAARGGEDAPSLRLLGELHWRRGDMSEALDYSGRALERAPGFDLARDFRIRLLLQTNRLDDARREAEILVESPLENPAHRLLLASVLVRLGEHERACDLYRALLDLKADQPQLWQNLGHVLKTLGKQAEAIAAYREAVARQPSMGEAWWSLANLKTARLGAEDIAAMEAALATLPEDGDEQAEDRFHLHFALGKALEDAKDYAASFRHYDEGNRLRRARVPHDPEAFSAEATATAQTFTAPFLATLGDGGCPAPDPIFVVGLPRSGSTLVEQILSSHSQVEGTLELPDMMIIASRLQARVDEGEFADFKTMIESLTARDRVRLGEEYLEGTRVHRKSDAPLFIDKMPNNWQHVGLIRTILPNAKIVDARRHPMSCCFSGWKQHFARGQTFTYDLAEIARYYRDYVGLMAAYDAAAPGAVHRVIYEDMVRSTEAEIRRLLTYLDLPFEEACLHFHTNARAVRTASSEQVRQPIFTTGLDAWTHYAPWLAPLQEALGPIEAIYPEPPAR